METQQTTVPKLYIGVNIDKLSWKAHCSTDTLSGKTFSMNPDLAKLRSNMERPYIVYEISTENEAGCYSYYTHRSFEGYGWCSLVVNPADIHRKGKERVTKTYHIDTQVIAREFKEGRLQGIHVPKVEREQLRSFFGAEMVW